MNKDKKKSLLVFVDADVVIRHFIKNETFRDLESEYNLTFVFNQDSTTSKKGVHADVTQLGLERILHTQVPRRRNGYWYLLFAATVLRQHRGLKNFKDRRRQLVAALGKRNVLLLEWAGLPVVYQLFRGCVKLLMGEDESVKQLIEEENPDAILHPTVLNGYYINELLVHCGRTDIPLVVLMNSWDNTSSKAVSTGLPTVLVVWGEQSRQQAIDYMRIPEDRIKSFGAAQFQVYRKPPVESTDQLREMFRVPDNKKIILYAGSGAGDHETQYLRLLEAGIEKGLITNCHVIYRPHPWRGGLGDGEEDFYSIKWKHITMDPFMEEYYQKEVKCDEGHVFMVDYAISNKLLTLVDAVISPLSTMLIESLIKGKPVLAFFPERHHEVIFSVGQVHFADFLAIPDVNVCLREEDFYPACQKLLAQTDDEALAEKLKQHADHFVDMDAPHYGHRLKLLVDRVTHSHLTL